MSKINELIQTLCPDGVEYKKLGDLEQLGWIELGRGQVLSKSYIQDNPGNFPVFSSAATNNGVIGRCNTYMFTDSRITWSIDGGGKFFYRNDPYYSVTNVCGWLRVNDFSVLNLRYLYFALMNEWSKKIFDYVHKAYPSVIREEYIIPIPHIAVQEEIVRILDEYTKLEAELEAKLSEEIELKQKQYEVYRDELLTFGDDVEYKKLKDVSSFVNGKGHEKNIVNDGRYIVVNSKFVSTNGIVKKYSDVQICPLHIDDILMVMSDLPNGRALAKCYLVDENDKYTLNQRIGCFHTLNENIISTKFLFNVLNRNYQLLSYDNGIDQTNLRKDAILNIEIPVPSPTEQERIVKILDKYDIYTRDMISTLNTELESRKKQYAYYRDQLLTFKRKE